MSQMQGSGHLEVEVPVRIVRSRSFFRRARVVVEMPDGSRRTLHEGDTLNVHAKLDLKLNQP